MVAKIVTGDSEAVNALNQPSRVALTPGDANHRYAYILWCSINVYRLSFLHRTLRNCLSKTFLHIHYGIIDLVLESDDNSESWQENRIFVSCSSFDIQTSLSNKRCFVWIEKLVCRLKDEQDTAIRFTCHDSELSSDSGTYAVFGPLLTPPSPPPCTVMKGRTPLPQAAYVLNQCLLPQKLWVILWNSKSMY